MRQVQAPDLIAILLACLTTLVGASLAWSYLDGFWQHFIVSVSAAPPPIITLFWWLGSQRLRLRVYRWYYRFAGPRCTMQVLGNIPTCPDEESDLLQRVAAIAERWNSAAHPIMSVANSIVFEAGPRTLTVDVLTEHADEDAEDGEEYPDSERQIRLALHGYEGTLSRMDSLVSGEVAGLLERFVTDMCRPGATPNFTLKIQIQGTNPFMAFYLRDVPAGAINNFHLSLTEDLYGASAALRVTASSVDVATRSPGALTRAAKRYLATPALAHVD